MKKQFTKALSFVMAVCMMLTIVAVAAPVAKAAPAAVTTAAELAAQKMVGCTEEHVDEVTVGGRTCYMYVPVSNRVGNFLALTPIMVVFGDEAFTSETALATAHEKGFAEIAERDGLCVLFANPVDSWETDDADDAQELFAGIYNTYSSRPDVVFVNGKGTADAGTEKERTVYAGSLHGLQFFATGKGADYVAANFTTPKIYATNYAIQEFSGLPGYPSGIALFAPSELTVQAKGAGLVIPMAIVNGPENAKEVADSYNQNAGIYKVVVDETVTDFDAELVTSLYDSVVSKFYYSQGQFRVVPHYNLNGVVEINDTKTVSSGKAVEVYEYIDADLDLSIEGSVPLMVWCHGMGGEGEAMLSWSEWPEIAGEEGFMVVSIDQHTSFTAEDILEALDMIIEEYPFVDTTRIYASGFSMGSAKTWEMAFKNWRKFAGIIPCALGIFGQAAPYLPLVEEGCIMPTFYLAGGKSTMELGSSMFTQGALTVLNKMNGLVEGEYTYSADYEWGIPSYNTTRITYRDDADGLIPEADTEVINAAGQKTIVGRHQVLRVDEFKSPDGNVYTWLAVNEKKPHTLTNNDAHIVWQYMKRFSRNADGTISIAEEEPSELRAELTAEMTGNAVARVDEIEVAGRTCYMYVPESERVGNFLCLTPIVTVFGDEAFTAETAFEVAQESFKEIAERDGLCILFVNPIEAWGSETDEAASAELYSAIYDTYCSRPSVKFEGGKGVYNGKTVYCGSLHGLQMFGLGSGAEYVAEHYTTFNTYASNYAEQFFAGLPGNPSGIALFAPETLTVPEGDSLVIPMAIVNGPENADEYARAFQGEFGIYRTVRDESVVDFDAELVTELYDKVVSKYYYSQGQFRESPKYTVNGIIEVNKTKTLANGKTVEYYEYIPETLDTETPGETPLLLWFHGGGGEAEAMVSWTEWPLVGQEYGFEVISVDQHQLYTSTEVVELLDMILAERSYLDETRVYAGGFSMGGGKTWNVGLNTTERFAGIIPTAAGTMAEAGNPYDKNLQFGSIIPVFYVAGGSSFLAELPKATPNNVNEVLTYLWSVNRLGTYKFDAEATSKFGQDYDSVTVIPYEEICDFAIDAVEDTTTIHEFVSEDGNTYTYLCINAGKPHTLTAADAHNAWNYIGRFSRVDGTICIDGEPVEEVEIPTDNYTDVDDGTWFTYAFNYLVSRGLMNGMTDSTMEPATTVNRAMVVVMLYRLAGEPEVTGENPYTDVPEDSWFRDAVVWALENEITSGTSATTFSPALSATRQQIVTFLYRYAKSVGVTGRPGNLSTFADAADVAEWAEEAMAWAVGAGLVVGSQVNGETVLTPNVETNRAQIAVMLTRFLAKNGR